MELLPFPYTPSKTVVLPPRVAGASISYLPQSWVTEALFPVGAVKQAETPFHSPTPGVGTLLQLCMAGRECWVSGALATEQTGCH